MKILYPAVKPLGNESSPSLADIKAHTNQVYNSSHFSNSYYYFYVRNERRMHRRDNRHQEFSHDGMTVAHETTHQINSEIADKNGHRDNVVGLYCLSDVGFVLKEPKNFRIQDVAPLVPRSFRTAGLGVYDLYLKQQAAAWGDRPLYLCDEWVAYTNGAQVALELAQAGDQATDRWSEIQNAICFNMFCCVTYSLTDKNDELKEFFSFQLSRVKSVYQQSMELAPLKREDTIKWFEEFERSEFFTPFKVSIQLKDYGTGEYL